MAFDELRTFYPEIIEENPFPGQEIILPVSVSEGGKNDEYQPATSKDVKLPKKRTAVELLSTALNTRSRKILQEFELQQSGGFQIGNFQEGLSGDLKVTPNGITARNISGVTTFAINGDDGSAIFAGEIRAGSFVTGAVEVTDGYIALYNDGILQIFIGDDGT